MLSNLCLLTKMQKQNDIQFTLLALIISKTLSFLVTAIMASSILKSMAVNVESTKDKKLYGEIMAHSKLAFIIIFLHNYQYLNA